MTSNQILYIELYNAHIITATSSAKNKKYTAPSNFREVTVKMQTSLPMPSSKVSLKLFVHKTSNQVLFAEAGKEFVDFFSNILLLPVGALITILEPEVVLGHLGNINESIVNLSKSFGRRVRSDLIHFPPNGVKESLYLVKNNLELKPLSTASIIPLLDEFHVKELDLEEIVVDLGVDEVYI